MRTEFKQFRIAVSIIGRGKNRIFFLSGVVWLDMNCIGCNFIVGMHFVFSRVVRRLGRVIGIWS